MKRLKFDISEMTDYFNTIQYIIGKYNCKIENMECYKTKDQMSDAIIKHAVLVGYKLGSTSIDFFTNFISLNEFGYVEHFNDNYTWNDIEDSDEIGLDFFKIKPMYETYLVEMPEEDYENIIDKTTSMNKVLNICKWKLINESGV